MKTKGFRLAWVALLLLCVAWGCSGGPDPGGSERKDEIRANATAKAIRDHAQAPINRAKSAASLGDDRLEAMDRAVQSAN